jgi:renal tumor antigen
VLKAQCVKSGRYVAIKCMKNKFDSIDQVNNLREIQALRRLSPHSHIIKLLEVLYDQPTGRLALVFELMVRAMRRAARGGAPSRARQQRVVAWARTATLPAAAAPPKRRAPQPPPKRQDMNIYELIRGRRHYVAEDRVRAFMYQLLRAMDHMHRWGALGACAARALRLVVGSVLEGGGRYWGARGPPRVGDGGLG